MPGDGHRDGLPTAPVRTELADGNFGFATGGSGGACVGEAGEADPGNGGEMDEVDPPGFSVQIEAAGGFDLLQDGLSLSLELGIVLQKRHEGDSEGAVRA